MLVFFKGGGVPLVSGIAQSQDALIVQATFKVFEESKSGSAGINNPNPQL